MVKSYVKRVSSKSYVFLYNFPTSLRSQKTSRLQKEVGVLLKQHGLSSEGLHVAELMRIGMSESSVTHTEHDLVNVNTSLAVHATSVAYKVKLRLPYT